MFVNFVKFPPLKPGKDAAFLAWFRESNAVYQKFTGFISRRLLKPAEPGEGYAAIVEHESEQSFMAMHTSPQRQEVWTKVQPLLDGSPAAAFYQVIEAATADSFASTKPA